MKCIRTPTGETFLYNECEIFDDYLCEISEFFNAANEEKLAKELFENTGILIGELKGGENTG